MYPRSDLLNVVPDLEKSKDKLLEQSKLAIEEDGADVLIIGCAMMFGVDKWLQEKLGVPVISPGDVAVKMAEMLVDMKLAQSKRAYAKPLIKK